MVHPDYQYDPRLLPEIVRPIQEGAADVVLGSRLKSGSALSGGMPWWKYISNRFLTGVENTVFGLQLSEYHTGYRAYRREVLETVNFTLNADKFIFDQEIMAQVVEAGFRIAEVPVPTRYFAEASSASFLASTPLRARHSLAGAALRAAPPRLLAPAPVPEPARPLPGAVREPDPICHARRRGRRRLRDRAGDRGDASRRSRRQRARRAARSCMTWVPALLAAAPARRHVLAVVLAHPQADAGVRRLRLPVPGRRARPRRDAEAARARRGSSPSAARWRRLRPAPGREPARRRRDRRSTCIACCCPASSRRICACTLPPTAPALSPDVVVVLLNPLDFLNPSFERDLKPQVRYVLPPWDRRCARAGAFIPTHRAASSTWRWRRSATSTAIAR